MGDAEGAESVAPARPVVSSVRSARPGKAGAVPLQRVARTAASRRAAVAVVRREPVEARTRSA